MSANKKFTNDLSKETSPYLLQHAHNPVQWKPWSETLFVTATAADKPKPAKEPIIAVVRRSLFVICFPFLFV